MTGTTFAKRLDFLANHDYPVLPLDEALEKLRWSNLPKNATVITIDDGWYGTFKYQYPELRKRGFPATLYLATYYLEKKTQVFNMALRYVIWKSGIREFNLALLGEQHLGSGTTDIEDVTHQLIELGDSLGAVERQSLLRDFCEAVGFDWRFMESERLLSFMTGEEAAIASANNIDLQLHTHRHRFPDNDINDARLEVEDNRRVLKKITQTELRHFCYPSGIYSPASMNHLRDLDIDTATTTKPGFNMRGTSVFELRRFLDSESISELEFEAELSGFFELIRRCGYNI